jgi:hypothetical protein
MGRRAWMGVIGVCALLTGCQGRERAEPAPTASARTPAPSRPTATPSSETARASDTATPARTESPSNPVVVAEPPASTVGRTTVPGAAPGLVTSTSPRAAPAPGTQAAPAAQEGRVMIGSDAIQASEDEDWFKGAARAAQAFQDNNSQPLEQVVIASGSVDGKISRVSQNTVHVRDPEGNVYQLRIDKKSRGLRQGQRVPLKELNEGTPVRASFDLVGGGSIARDIEVRR